MASSSRWSDDPGVRLVYGFPRGLAVDARGNELDFDAERTNGASFTWSDAVRMVKTYVQGRAEGRPVPILFGHEDKGRTYGTVVDAVSMTPDEAMDAGFKQRPAEDAVYFVVRPDADVLAEHDAGKLRFSSPRFSVPYSADSGHTWPLAVTELSYVGMPRFTTRGVDNTASLGATFGEVAPMDLEALAAEFAALKDRVAGLEAQVAAASVSTPATVAIVDAGATAEAAFGDDPRIVAVFSELAQLKNEKRERLFGDFVAEARKTRHINDAVLPVLRSVWDGNESGAKSLVESMPKAGVPARTTGPAPQMTFGEPVELTDTDRAQLSARAAAAMLKEGVALEEVLTRPEYRGLNRKGA